MNRYLYRWNLSARPGLRVEVEVAALSVCDARRTVREFLLEHDGTAWELESVSRAKASVSRSTQSGPPNYVLSSAENRAHSR